MTKALGHERNDLIDTFRGVAILSVMAYHYTGGPVDDRVWHFGLTNVGRFGVQLFFIISGVVIGMTVRSCSGRPDEFLVKRLARLYPTYLAVMVVTFIVMRAVASPFFHHYGGDLIRTLVLYDGSQPFIDPSYWSLVPELKFYGYVGLSMLLFRGAYWIGLVLLTLAGLLATLTHHMNVADKLLVAEYMPLFLLGVSTWMLVYERRWTGWICAAAALVAFPAAQQRFDPHFGPQWLMLAFIGGSGGLMIALLALKVRAPANPLSWIGRRSYSLYLLHQALGITALSALQRSGAPVAVSLVVVAAAMLLLAHISFRFVEEPSRAFVVNGYRALRRWGGGLTSSPDRAARASPGQA